MGNACVAEVGGEFCFCALFQTFSSPADTRKPHNPRLHAPVVDEPWFMPAMVQER